MDGSELPSGKSPDHADSRDTGVKPDEREKKLLRGRLKEKVGAATAKRLIVLAIVLGITLAVSTKIVWPIIPLDAQYLRYVQIGEVAIVGYFAIRVVSEAVFKVVSLHSEQAAKTAKTLNSFAGAIIVAAVIISYLSQDPIIAVSISTISGIVVGFASQNIIGNLIAGVYLVIARPFRIGDKINVFGQWGIVGSIELLYCRIHLENGDLMLTPNSALVTTNVILRRPAS